MKASAKRRNQISDDIVKQVTSEKHSKKRPAIDCSTIDNHGLLIREGVRLPNETGLTRMQDGKPFYFQKNDEEKKKLKKLKQKFVGKKWKHYTRTDELPFYNTSPMGKLIIHILNNKKINNFYNTLSFIVRKSDIPSTVVSLSEQKIKILQLRFRPI